MKLLFLTLLYIQLLFSSENVKLSNEQLFIKQAEIQAIIDEQFPQEENDNVLFEDEKTVHTYIDNDEQEIQNEILRNQIPEKPVDHFERAVVHSSFINQSSSKFIYADYDKVPKIVFKNQRFKVSLKATITTDAFDKIETRFINHKNISILNPKNKWEYGNKNNYLNKYYFKVETKNFVMPTFQVLMYKEGKVFEIITLKPKNIKYTNVSDEKENFSNIIAQKLEIVSHKTKQYTNTQLLTILELKSKQGNLEDFHLKKFKEQGLNSLEEKGSTQTALYYAVIPVFTKKISFEYYNSELNNFKRVQSQVVLSNELVSTQTDLNPNKSNILFYKKVLFAGLSIFFFILFLIRRKFFSVFLTLIFLIIFILYNLPNEMVKVKQNSNIYILPTNKSTVFFKLPVEQKVEILNKKDNFVKIFFKKRTNSQEIIGWIKESNIVKN